MILEKLTSVYGEFNFGHTYRFQRYDMSMLRCNNVLLENDLENYVAIPLLMIPATFCYHELRSV